MTPFCLRCKKDKPRRFGYCNECLAASKNARKNFLKQWERYWKAYYERKTDGPPREW